MDFNIYCLYSRVFMLFEISIGTKIDADFTLANDLPANNQSRAVASEPSHHGEKL